MNTRGFAGCVAIALLAHVGIAFGCSFGSLDAQDDGSPAPALVWFDSIGEEQVGGEPLAAQTRAETTRAKELAPRAVARARSSEPADVVGFDATSLEPESATAAAGESPGSDGGLPFDFDSWGQDAGGAGGGLALRRALGARRVTRLGSSGPMASQAHGPRLQPVSDPCRGMFPAGAEHDRGSVVVALRVSASGVPTGPRVIEEFPRGEGFAEAARACLPRLRFEPAADSRGTPVTAESVVRLRFNRG